MAIQMFSQVALAVDFPEHDLKAGDIATVVDCHMAGTITGYSLEVFNATGGTIAVIITDESQIEPLQHNEILHIRHFDRMAA
jgi:hypothetical protein